jgi:hypothetical protein
MKTHNPSERHARPLPDTVTFIGTVATHDCGGLNSVIGSGPGAFVRCGGLTSALLFWFVR